MRKNFFITGCLFLASYGLGQTSVNTIGGTVSNNSGSVSYSIGQVAYQSISNTSGMVTQGVQQAYIISTMNLDEKTFNFSLTAYPNPTTDHLILRVGNFNQEKLFYKVIDVAGKLIGEGKITQSETNLEMENLPSASYFVEVYHEYKKVQNFKIIKN
jgi:hypothetical protein